VYVTVSALDDPVTFYADSLQKAFKGMGTNDDQLIRIIVSRAEVWHASNIWHSNNNTLTNFT
jgi:hypothetical protein